MSKPRFLTQSLGRKYLSIVVVSLLLLITTLIDTARPQENGAVDRQAAFRRIVQSYVQAGKGEYDKGFYEQAFKTFVMAQRYQEYLPETEREDLHAHLEKAKTAAAQRELALEKFQAADQSIKDNQLLEAKASLESLRNNEYLTKDEQMQIAAVLEQIELQAKMDQQSAQITADKPEAAEEVADTDEQKKEQNQKIAELYRSSMKYYRAGQFEKARDGFVTVKDSGLIPPRMKKTIEGYLAEIDKHAPQKIEIETAKQEKTEAVAVIEPKAFNFEAALQQADQNGQVSQDQAQPGISGPETKMVSTPGSASTESGEGTYIEQITKKRNILRTYTGTVVNNATAKANNYINQGQFDKAKKEVEVAEFTVNENQIHLGDELFKEYSSRLKALADEIAEKQSEKARQDEEEKRKAAIEAQSKFRQQAEIDRQNRISELMKNALAYQEQQQYEAALGQLKSLLALDPQNNEALILKDTLEDTISFRKQSEVKKESDRRRAEMLLKTEESTIPYAEELTYPKNWREIIEKPTRQEEKPIGLDPADAAVYEKLEQTVDLPNLTPSTAFADVLEQLKTSVEPPLQIQPNWKDLLENAELEPTTPAGMDPLIGVKLRKALEVLLAGVSTADISEVDYIVDEGVIQIATVETLPKKMVTRVYDITDLVGQPSQYGGLMGMMMGMSMGNMITSMNSTAGYTVSSGLPGSGTGTGGIGGTTGGYGGGGLGGGYGGGMGGYGGGMMGGMGGMGGMGMMGGMGGMGGYGGGMMGGMGGMGGYGGGMMGGMGGMGGYGGGMGGYGGGGGGMYGGGMGSMQSQSLIQLIEESIDPESWFDLSDLGEGTITPYPTQLPKKLAVYNTHEVHREVQELLTALRKSLGHQVSIEARFLVVSENFLEDIGLDVDFTYNLGGKWGQLTFLQDSAVITQSAATQVPLTFGGLGDLSAGAMAGGYGSILDDLQVAFLLRATQAHRDSKALTAPVATVLSGESATFNISRTLTFALPPVQTQGVTNISGTAGTTTTGQGTVPQYITVPIGSVLSITPIITHDKKNVLLDIITIQNEYLGLTRSEIEAPIVGQAAGQQTVQNWHVDLPETERSSLLTRVSVPDSGTLLLGGQRISAEVEQEAGVPVLSKLPLVGRLFSNRSKIRDHKILLILVKPTIMLQEEREAEAIAAMEGEI